MIRPLLNKFRKSSYWILSECRNTSCYCYFFYIATSILIILNVSLVTCARWVIRGEFKYVLVVKINKTPSTRPPSHSDTMCFQSEDARENGAVVRLRYPAAVGYPTKQQIGTKRIRRIINSSRNLHFKHWKSPLLIYYEYNDLESSTHSPLSPHPTNTDVYITNPPSQQSPVFPARHVPRRRRR